MNNRRSMLAGLLSLGGLSAVAKAAPASDKEEAVFNSGLQLFFAQRDTVINFNPSTGLGDHIGTVEGAIVGCSIVNFQFIPTSASTIKFDNRCMITDIDGDQIIFQVLGTGRFLPPFIDANNAALGNLISPFAGPLVATYIAILTTGKYAFLQGRKFPCKMIASNAVQASNGVLGNVYVEVYSDQVAAVSAAIAKGRNR